MIDRIYEDEVGPVGAEEPFANTPMGAEQKSRCLQTGNLELLEANCREGYSRCSNKDVPMLCLCEIIGCVTFLSSSNDPGNLISENLYSGSVLAINYHT